MPFLKLHALHRGLEESPQHTGICNRGSGEGRGYQARCRTADSSQQEHGDRSREGKQGQEANEREAGWVEAIHPLRPRSRKRASAATAAPNSRR